MKAILKYCSPIFWENIRKFVFMQNLLIEIGYFSKLPILNQWKKIIICSEILVNKCNFETDHCRLLLAESIQSTVYSLICNTGIG